MEKNDLLYEKPNLPDINFPLRVTRKNYMTKGESYKSHWHEHIELYYITEGNAIIECNSKPILSEKGDLIIVNSNELHSIQSLSDCFTYYCIIADMSLFLSSTPDACELRYITPITKNLILFSNKIKCNGDLYNNIKGIIDEYETKQTGYELAVKSHLYGLLVGLLRNHVEKVFTQSEYNKRLKHLERLNKILKYIEDNYTQKITADVLAELCNLSVYHFCHTFKEATGKPLNEYVNSVRINKAEVLIKNTSMSMTEIAIACGFDDTNYFSRLFKKLKNVSPTTLRK